LLTVREATVSVTAATVAVRMDFLIMLSSPISSSERPSPPDRDVF
jgi:hypothetical protein